MTNEIEAGGNAELSQSQPGVTGALLLDCLTREDWQRADCVSGQSAAQSDTYDPACFVPIQNSGNEVQLVNANDLESYHAHLAASVLPSISDSRNGISDRTLLQREGDTSCDTNQETKVLLERWNKMLDDAQIPKGPNRDILAEIGRQFLSGEFDAAKLQKMLEQESRRFDAILKEGDRDTIRKELDEYSKFQEALRKIDQTLRAQGVSLDFSGRGVWIAEPARKQEWVYTIKMDEHGTSQHRRLFHDPSAPGLTALRNDREDVTAEAAFKALSDRFKRALGPKH